MRTVRRAINLPDLIAMGYKVEDERELIYRIANSPGPAAAEKLAKEFVEHNHDEPILLTAWGEMLHWCGRYQEALSQAERALSFDPNCCEAHSLKACVYAFLGDAKTARACYEKAAATGEVDCALFALSDVYAVEGNIAGSLEVSVKLAERRPNCPRAWSLLQASLRNVGMVDEAKEMLENAPEAVKKTSAYSLWVARHHLLMHDAVEAEHAARAATEIAPESPGGWVALGQALELQGKFVAADECATRALSLNPNDPVAWRILASAARNEADAEKMEFCNRKAEEAVPALMFQAKLNRVADLTFSERYFEALELARAIEPRLPEGLKSVAQSNILFLLETLGQWDELKEKLDEVESREADWYLGAVALATHQKQTSEAVRLAREGYEKHPESSAMLSKLVNVLSEAGLHQAVKAVSEKALFSPPKTAAGCWEVIDGFLEAGLQQEALNLLAYARNQFPEDQELLFLEMTLALSFGGDLPYQASA